MSAAVTSAEAFAALTSGTTFWAAKLFFGSASAIQPFFAISGYHKLRAFGQDTLLIAAPPRAYAHAYAGRGYCGGAAVLGRSDIPFREMITLDYLYVTNWSLWWDIKILCQTIPVVLGRRGAY